MRKLRLSLTFLSLAAASVPALPAADLYVYFGTHRSGPGLGFSVGRFNTDTGILTKPAFLLEAKDPAFFVITPDGRRLYACNAGAPGGLSAYAVDPPTARLTLLNQVPSGGGDPSYVSLDRTGRFALVSNYAAGNIAVFALQPDGCLGERTAFVQHAGRSVDPKRQPHAYAHSIIVDPTNRFVLTADPGLDRLSVYRFDAATGALAPNDPPFVTFHPGGRSVYLVNEMGCTVTAFAWDSATGRLTPAGPPVAVPHPFCARFLAGP